MAALTEWYVVRFKGANGRARYVGDGATMPFTEAEARIFRDKREAKAAFDRIGPHHKAEGAKPSILPRKGVIAFPVVATMLGVDQ